MADNENVSNIRKKTAENTENNKLNGKGKLPSEYNNKGEKNDNIKSILNNQSQSIIEESESKKSTKVSINDMTGIEKKENLKNEEETKLLFYPEIKDNKDNLFCKHCKQNLNIEIKDIYKLNCINIQCIYENCLKFSFISICPKCKAVLTISKVVFEGDLIKCSNKECGFLYLQISCPYKSCSELFYFTYPKISNNFPNGVIHIHDKKSTFQKINCFHCFKPIVYFLEKSENKGYYEMMKVKCPYADCSKNFNRIICTKCNEIIYMVLGLYMMGKKIKCPFCNFIFSKLLCPSCQKVSPYIKNDFKYGQFECRYNSCSKKFSLVNCCYCQRPNFFKLEKTPLIPGIKINCCYEDCKETFCEVVCLGCNEINYYPDGDFCFGKVYKCQYTAICSKSFMILVCPKCMNYSRIYEDTEGKKYTCNVCKTKTLLANFQCPNCFVNILDQDSSYIFGQIMKCPSCKKKFSFFRCYECKRLIYSKKEECILGKSITCDFCKNSSVNVICIKCESKITYPDRKEDLAKGEKTKCPQCKNIFDFGEEKNNSFIEYYDTNKLIDFKPEKPFPIKYGESAKDENYLEKMKIYFNYNENDKKNSINHEVDFNKFYDKTMCIICQSNIKESVFFPCGHRCSCYICAVYYYEVFKRCPRCDEKATGIIPKIFEV